ncbi:MAG: SDR family NAD(P)-dependent oxidoreductase [Pseudomonadota bacterium]
MSKTILITGATDGIGLLSARKLTEFGHRVLLHGRSAEKLADAAAQIGGSPSTYCADLSRISDVASLADAVLTDHARLDVLINNAGILKTPIVQTEAGRDIRFDVNAIAPYLLTKRLLPIIPKDGRVINLSSAAQAPVDLGAMAKYQPMGDMEAYAQSKLAITIWSAVLAKALPDGPSVFAVNPGSLLATKMVKEGFGLAGNDLNIGADILVTATLDPDWVDRSGRYFDNDSGRFAPAHPAAMDESHVNDVMRVLSDISETV